MRQQTVYKKILGTFTNTWGKMEIHIVLITGYTYLFNVHNVNLFVYIFLGESCEQVIVLPSTNTVHLTFNEMDIDCNAGKLINCSQVLFIYSRHHCISTYMYMICI